MHALCGKNETFLDVTADIKLNNVRQHNYFITPGTYIGYMFRLYFNHLQAYFVI